MQHLLDWKVGFCDSADARPETYFPATVPGAVQLDYAKEYGLPDYRRGTNYKEYKWMEDKFWVYTAEFDATAVSAEKLFFITKGIDYQYDIYVNGEKVCSYEGMYRSQEIDITASIGGKSKLEVVVYPIPRSALPGVHTDTRDEANQSCKPAVSYGWDFHPRLVPIGIWEDAYVEETKRQALVKPEVSYKLSEDRTKATVNFKAEGAADAKWQLTDPDGKVVFEGAGEEATAELNDVKLWWCNGYGEPNLYTWKLDAENMETKSAKIGFKTIALIKAPGSWNEGLNYPMSRNTPPITFVLNGKAIFMKGSNWVAPEIFYGTLNYDRYYEQLALVKKANLNFVRCWGGALINKQSFFEICDELGILVWQEFPLACNRYEGTEHYISVFKNEGPVIIDLVKSHPCLMLWCGGNELFNNWSLMTEQDEVMRLMNKYTYEETPGIPFISTAPVMGMAHGPYSFWARGNQEVIGFLPDCHNTAYTEFGCGGFSTKETLEMIGDLKDLMPMNGDNELATEHGTHWVGLPLKEYFGELDNIDDVIACGQMMQSSTQSFIFEEARRQKPYCSIVSNWCFNEPWPNTGNNSLVSYPTSIKPVYYAVTKACRSVLASARYRKFSYIAGEWLDFDLYLLNDSLEKVEDGAVKVYIQIGDHKEEIMTWEYKNVEINTNVVGPTLRYQLPHIEDADTVQIILECGEYSSKYTMLYRLPAKPVNAPRKMNAVLDENVVE